MEISITSIFGKYLRDTHSYVGWVKTKEGFSHLANCISKNTLPNCNNPIETQWGLITNAHTFLSQPMEEGDFVRWQEPIHPKNVNGFKERLEANINYGKWKNWKPLFKGEWEIENKGRFSILLFNGEFSILLFNGESTGIYVYPNGDFNSIDGHHIKTRNDFATHCLAARIPLELNEEYQIQ